MSTSFSKKLLPWHLSNHRPLPWKETKDPYNIWLSEIILQQTRVAQGTPYYFKFIKTFPTVNDLAAAPLDKILKLWEGLGYYSRARNLHFTAKTVVNEWEGKFPTTYKDLLSLKGVGEYTAAAIASFAYDEAIAVVDGNVYRVLSRVFGITEPIDLPTGKKLFKVLAQEQLDRQQPAEYNQAIMNFGALQCVPKNPNCAICPFQSDCVAFKKDTIELLPIKSKRILKNNRYFNYYIFYDDQQVIIQQRDKNDIWKMLFEFPMVESNQKLLTKNLMSKTNHQDINNLMQSSDEQLISKVFKQTLTHQFIKAKFVLVKINSLKSMELDQKRTLINRKELKQYAFPKIINSFLEETKLLL